jgi:hypothetical protein
MRRPIKICLVVVILLLGFVLAWLEFPFLVPPFQYLLFVHRSQNYYVHVGDACNYILAKNPVTSNDEVRLSRDATLHYAKRIFEDDPSVPGIIRRLSPEFVLIGTNWVSVSIPPERMGGFGIIWEQRGPQTNRWVLQAGEDELTTVYSVTNVARQP